MPRKIKRKGATSRKYRKKFDEIKKAENALQREQKRLDLKIKQLKKKVDALGHYPFIA